MKNLKIIIIILLLTLSTFAQQNYVCTNNTIETTFTAANDGKFRFKTREKDESFGKTFAARQKHLTKSLSRMASRLRCDD
ncbi:MAG: hypothetical protein HC846_14555 [Blastocatellia bacterium]|nr:hypothetical protein [Blastocatellia bacterium]